MTDNILKKVLFEPKVFAVLAGSTHGDVLHIGVHFSLEEAYAAAKIKMQSMNPNALLDEVDMEMWNMMEIREIIARAFEPDKSHIEQMVESLHPTPVGDIVNMAKPAVEPVISTDEYIKNLKDSKNTLMQKLIDDGDLEKVESAKGLLDAYSKRYVLKSIKEKNIK